MALPVPGRLLASLGILAAALFGATLVDGPLWGALLGLIGGALATLVAGRAFFFPEGTSAIEPPAADPDASARQIMDTLPDPMLLLRGGRIAAANGAAKALLGDWIEGEDARLVLRHPATVERLARAAQGENCEQIEVTGIGGAGRSWLLTVTSVEGGKVVRLSDRSQSLAAERMRVDFVANASHELRTPLATILGFIETLRDDTAADDKALRGRFLGIMDGEARRMQQLIDDLMSLSRIEAERFSVPTEPIDLLPLVEEVRAGCGHLLAKHGTSLVVENEAGDAVVPGDRTQLLQLLRNLIVNAAKYGRDGAEVTVRLAEEGGMLRLTVADRGEGIAAEHLPRLTERFYRVDPGRSRAEGGTGLGLAIVKHIVGRHRGRLDIASTLGEGTRVHVLLPRGGAGPS